MGQLNLGSTFISRPHQLLSLANSGLPIVVPSNGTVASTGIITLVTALPTVYADVWLYLPAGAIVGGIAGMYYAEFTSTTVGQVYTNFVNPTVVDFEPYDPVVETHVNAVGSGSAYTQTTGSSLVVMRDTLPGNLMGKSGSIEVNAGISVNNNANAKNLKFNFGEFNFSSVSLASILSANISKSILNRAATNKQVATALGSFGHGAVSGALLYGTVETKNDVIINVTVQLATATDYVVLEYVCFEATST
jgi:hypothetical protein